jgi:cytochrome b561
MSWRNQTNGYGTLSVVLHWSLALAIFSLFALGVWMVELDYYSTWYHDAPFVHKSLGVLVVLAMGFRWLWNRSHTQPAPLSPSLNIHRLAKLVHALLYGLVFLLGISGYLMATAEGQPISVFGWFNVGSLAWFEPLDNQADQAAQWHQWFAYTLMALVGLHSMAALKHHFINRDATLKRMLKPHI